MRAKTTVAATLICLSMAGCFKAGRKSPLVENKPNTMLVERYNEDLGKRLNDLQGDLMKVMQRESDAKMELKRYSLFEKNYLRNLEAKCEGVHENNLTNLHGEVMEWRKKVIGEVNQVALDITNLITSLQSEQLSMDTTENEVGQPIISEENRGMVLSLMRLSINLRNEVVGMDMGIVPAPECANGEAMAVKTIQKEESSTKDNKVEGQVPEGRSFNIELEPKLTKDETQADVDVYEDIFDERR